MFFKKAIHISASPNTEFDDVKLAIKLLIQLWKWKSKNYTVEFEKQIKDLYNLEGVITFDSARTALYILIKNLGIGKNDEVIIPSFSCHVIANSVYWNGAKNIFIDSDVNTFNFDLNDLKRKVSKNTKAIIVQHTFGITQDIDKIREIVGSDVLIIEDLAHNFGYPDKNDQYKIKGDFAIATFGVEKGFSGVRGGALLFKEMNEVFDKVSKEKLKDFPLSKTFISLLNPIFWFFTNKFYYIGFNKFVLGAALTFIARRIGILGHIIEKSEYNCEMPSWMPAKISPALAKLASHQLDKKDISNKHREIITEFYTKKFGKVSEDKILLRYPLKVDSGRAELIVKYKSNGILLGDWYRSILHVNKETLDILGYKGDCPKSEKLSKEIVNFPINIKYES